MPGGATHPRVNVAKYEREVENFERDAARYRSLGVFLLAADYPTVLIAFAAPQLKPSPLVFAMHADYTDYDLQPPSVRFVDPFTSEPYKASELPTMMMRSVEQPLPPGVAFPAGGAGQPGAPPGMTPARQADGPPLGIPASDPVADAEAAPGIVRQPAAAGPVVPSPQAGVVFVAQQPLLQAYGPDEIPFLCLAGTREYHQHPGHSGDSWELHRTTGAGSLVRLIEVVRTYAVEPIGGWSVNLVPQVTLGYGEAPR